MKKNIQQKRILGSAALLLCVLGYWVQPARGEGSKELVLDGGYRPYIEWSTGTSAGIPRKTILKVFVNKDEIVNLGSSVATSSDNQDIVYRSPFNGQNGVCNVDAITKVGFIDTIAKETAGPLPNSGGYTPCTFTAKETGIYEVEFHAPASSGDPPPKATNVQFPTDATQGQGVAAWDITVRDSGGNTKKGRVFANYVAMNMGDNAGGSRGGPSDLALNSKLYIQTKDGYRYETDMNGVDPYGFIFFGNSRGYIDTKNNSTVYHSAAGAKDNALNFAGNVRVQRPDVADTATDITHLVFFNRPDIETLLALSIPTTPVAPSTPSNFKFIGKSGTSGNQTYVGAGGYFSFGSTTTGTYQIIIDSNNDGIYDPSKDRVLQNPVSVGTNVVLWDGKDAKGVNLQPLPGNAPYNAQVTIRGGEYHFPMLDAENNPKGFRITMENPPAAFPPILDQNGEQIGINTVYYNDDNYTTADGTIIDLGKPEIPTSPRNASRGINSSTGEHEFSLSYGDFKGIDTWAYFPSNTVVAPLVITTTNQANVIGTKSVRFLTDADNTNSVTVGDTVEYTITYSNLNPGNSDAINFVIKDDLPSQLTFVNATISAQTSGNNITLNSNYKGSGAVTNSGTLRVGDTITIKITAKINNANNGNPISNQASATFNTPDNAATTGTVVTDADSAGGTSNKPTLLSSFVQTADDKADAGNDPSKTDDDDPTLFTVVNLNYQVSANVGKVIINEVLYNETGNGNTADTNDEFIEIYNASNSAVDLSGWKLMDGNLIANDTDNAGSITGNSSPYLFPNGTTLAPGKYAVIWIGANNASHQATGATFQAWLNQPVKLNNTGDDVWLYDSQNGIVDYIAYGSGNGINAPPPTSLNLWDSTYQSALATAKDGQSISLTKNGLDGNVSACWEPTTSGNAKTQGCQNYLPTRDTDSTGSRVTSVGENNNGIPKLILVKRITRINGNTSNGSVDLTKFVDDPNTTDDNNSKWSSDYLKGEISGGAVKPGDELEYTIYFLSSGDTPVKNVTICDLLPQNSTFIGNAFGSDSGIALGIGSNITSLTNVNDSDRAQFIPPNTLAPSACNKTEFSKPLPAQQNLTGAVIVNVVSSTTLPDSAPGSPAYGFIRFRAKVK